MTPDRVLRLELGAVALPDWGWHYDDPVRLEKLAGSIGRHGQLQPVVVRQAEAGGYELVSGRGRLAALRALGRQYVTAVDVGAVDRASAQRMALDLELHAEIDYAKLAFAIAALAEASEDPAAFPGQLAATAPWDAERIGYFVKLARFDWSQFSGAPEGQGALFGDEAAPTLPRPELAVPPPEPAMEQTIEPQAADAVEVWDGPLPEDESPVPLPAVTQTWTSTGPQVQIGLFGD